MADQKLTALTENTAPSTDDIIYMVDDPGGTPASRKVTIANSIYKNPYCFRAYASGGTTLTDNAVVQISLATEVYDYNGNFATSAYTAPVGGVYHFDGNVAIAGAVTTPVDMIIFLYVDGAEHTRGSRVAVGSLMGLNISADMLLTAGQVVTLRFYQQSAGDELSDTGSNLTWFSGHLVRMT